MNTTILLEKLIDIERSIGVETNMAIRNRVFDVQHCVLEMQKEMVENLRKEPRRFVFAPRSSSGFAA